MLKEIFVDGYKSINQVQIELKRFTLFSGVNSAGKSSATVSATAFPLLWDISQYHFLWELPQDMQALPPCRVF